MSDENAPPSNQSHSVSIASNGYTLNSKQDNCFAKDTIPSSKLSYVHTDNMDDNNSLPSSTRSSFSLFRRNTDDANESESVGTVRYSNGLKCEHIGCETTFYLSGRHHCRKCGISVCGKHSKKNVKFDNRCWLRLCLTCNKHLKNGFSASQLEHQLYNSMYPKAHGLKSRNGSFSSVSSRSSMHSVESSLGSDAIYQDDLNDSNIDNALFVEDNPAFGNKINNALYGITEEGKISTDNSPLQETNNGTHLKNKMSLRAEAAIAAGLRGAGNYNMDEFMEADSSDDDQDAKKTIEVHQIEIVENNSMTAVNVSSNKVTDSVGINYNDENIKVKETDKSDTEIESDDIVSEVNAKVVTPAANGSPVATISKSITTTPVGNWIEFPEESPNNVNVSQLIANGSIQGTKLHCITSVDEQQCDEENAFHNNDSNEEASAIINSNTTLVVTTRKIISGLQGEEEPTNDIMTNTNLSIVDELGSSVTMPNNASLSMDGASELIPVDHIQDMANQQQMSDETQCNNDQNNELVVEEVLNSNKTALHKTQIVNTTSPCISATASPVVTAAETSLGSIAFFQDSPYKSNISYNNNDDESEYEKAVGSEKCTGIAAAGLESEQEPKVLTTLEELLNDQHNINLSYSDSSSVITNTNTNMYTSQTCQGIAVEIVQDHIDCNDKDCKIIHPNIEVLDITPIVNTRKTISPCISATASPIFTAAETSVGSIAFSQDSAYNNNDDEVESVKDKECSGIALSVLETVINTSTSEHNATIISVSEQTTDYNIGEVESSVSYSDNTSVISNNTYKSRYSTKNKKNKINKTTSLTNKSFTDDYKYNKDIHIKVTSKYKSNNKSRYSNNSTQRTAATTTSKSFSSYFVILIFIIISILSIFKYSYNVPTLSKSTIKDTIIKDTTDTLESKNSIEINNHESNINNNNIGQNITQANDLIIDITITTNNNNNKIVRNKLLQIKNIFRNILQILFNPWKLFTKFYKK